MANFLLPTVVLAKNTAKLQTHTRWGLSDARSGKHGHSHHINPSSVQTFGWRGRYFWYLFCPHSLSWCYFVFVFFVLL